MGKGGGKKGSRNRRVTGTVINYWSKRGFGFIKPSDGGEKLFAHWSSIKSLDKWPRLEKGMSVEYKEGVDDDGRQSAFDISMDGGIEVACPEEEKVLSTLRISGIVKFFTPKGFGFIETTEDISWPEKLPSGSDIYVSREELEMAEESTVSLWRGMEVEFNVYKPDKGGVAAANVTAPGGDALEFQRPERTSERRGKGKGGKGMVGQVRSKGTNKGKTDMPVKRTIVKAQSTRSPRSWVKGGTNGGKSRDGKGKGNFARNFDRRGKSRAKGA